MRTDVVVVGGGIAGVSAAYELAKTRQVVLVEAEAHLAYHSTGRSAAMLIENYGAEGVRPLSVASRSFFADPPDGLADEPLMAPRGVIWIARHEHADLLASIAEAGEATGGEPEPVTPEEAAKRVPVLRADRLAGALWEPDPCELDVAAIHQSYVRGFRRHDGTILTSSRVEGLERSNGRWKVRAGDTDLEADVIVNAAGAWGDVVAELAGVAPVGLQPLRRTAFMVAGEPEWAQWPMVLDAANEFYFKSDGPQLLCSPADETPVEPGDARPDPADVALAIERINEVTTLEIRSVRSEWAGLRTFAPDRNAVIGPDPSEPSFHWLVGQGGTGIQTAPAAAELCAALVNGMRPPSHLLEMGVDPDQLSPSRFGRHQQ